MDEMTSNELYKLIEYLKAEGWTEKEIYAIIMLNAEGGSTYNYLTAEK